MVNLETKKKPFTPEPTGRTVKITERMNIAFFTEDDYYLDFYAGFGQRVEPPAPTTKVKAFSISVPFTSGDKLLQTGLLVMLDT